MSFDTFAIREDELVDAPVLMDEEETEEEDEMGDAEESDDEDDTI